MAAPWNRAGHYIFALWFLSSILSSFFFSSPNLSGRRLDVYHTSTHGVALVLIWNAGLKCAARGSLEMQDPKNRQKFAIWAPSHNFASSQLRHVPTIGKKVLNSNVSHKRLHNVMNFGLAAEICWRVLGTPAKFNGFRVLAALLHGTLVVGVSQTLRRQQRAPPIFGRATITLGIGPHF